MMLGSDCTHWSDIKSRYCGKHALFLRRRRGDGAIVGVLCRDHARTGDTAIPAGADRAEPATVWRDARFIYTSERR